MPPTNNSTKQESMPDGWNPIEVAKFLDAFEKHYRAGGRVVPMLGSGFSYASGIPTTAGITNYLTHCLLGAVGNPDLYDDDFRKRLFGNYEHTPVWNQFWDPRADPWPHVTEPALQKAEERLRKLAEILLRNDQTANNPLLRQVYGALADWRAALQLLSRLGTIGNGADKRAICTAQDDSVIDRFFNRMTEGKEPNPCHRILVALCRRLHINLLLTPNFDDLIEIAFAQAGASLKSFDVHRDASLPPPSALAGHRRTLVKLHGGQFGLRADFTLDAPPSEEDRKRFKEYLCPKSPRRPTTKTILLVGGLSVNDPRIISFIKDSLENREVVIFWICHSLGDYSALKEKFRSEISKNVDSETIVSIIHPYLNLLFSQLYTRCIDAPPSTGMLLPNTWNLPCPPYFPTPTQQKFQNIYDKQKTNLTNWLTEKIKYGKASLQILQSKHKESVGLPTICAEIFRTRALGINYEYLWFAFNNDSSPAVFFIRLLEAIAGDRRHLINSFNLENYNQDESSWRRFRNQYAKLLEDLLKDSSRTYLVFLCAMNEPGVGLTDNDLHSWRNHSERFQEFLGTLSNQSIPVQWIVVSEWVSRKPHEQRQSKGQTWELTVPVVNWNKDSRVEEALRWANSRGKKQLLFVLATYRIVRDPLMLQRAVETWTSRGFTTKTGRAESAADKLSKSFKDWVHQLEMRGVLRIKPGNYIWMNVDVRDGIRNKLTASLGENSNYETLRVNMAVARSYGRYLLGSMDPLAAFECLKHVFYGIEAFFKMKPKDMERFAVDASALLMQGNQVVRIAWNLIIGSMGETFSSFAIGKSLRDVVQLYNKRFHESNTINRSGQTTKIWLLAYIDYAGGLAALLLMALEIQGGDCHVVLKTLEELEDIITGVSGPINKVKLQSVIRVKHDITKAVVLLRGRRYEQCLNVVRSLLGKIQFWEICELEEVTTGVHLFRLKKNGRKLVYTDTEIIAIAVKIRDINPGIGTEVCLRLLRRAVYYLMHASQLKFVLARKDKSADGKEAIDLLEQARFICDISFAMLRMVGSATEAFVCHENARFRAHAALIEGRLACLHGPRRNVGLGRNSLLLAENLLSDAESFLELFNGSGKKLSIAVIELRRAEVTIQRIAVELPRFRELRVEYGEGDKPIAVKKNARLDKEQSENLLALLRDFEGALSRVEYLLRAFPSSKWWWQVHEVLSLKLCEYWIAFYCFKDDRMKALPYPNQMVTSVNLNRFAENDVFQLARAGDAAARILALLCCLEKTNRVSKDREMNKKNSEVWIVTARNNVKIICLELEQLGISSTSDVYVADERNNGSKMINVDVGVLNFARQVRDFMEKTLKM